MSTSDLHVDLTVDLSPFVGVVSRHIPPSFDEHGHPEADSYRWDLRRLRGPVLTPLADGRMELTVSYYGDLETKAIFPGCHLGSSPGVYDPSKSWVYIDLTVSARPQVAQEGSSWIARLVDVSAAVSLGPDSDTKCSIFGIDAREKLNQLLGSASLAQAIAAAVDKVRVPVPLEDLLTRANAPVRLPLVPAGASAPLAACIALNISRVEVEPLRGTPEAVTVPVVLYLDPQVSLTTQPACPLDRAAPRPHVVVK